MNLLIPISSHAPSKRHSRAFTLVEVLFVVSIMAIVVSLSSFTLSRTLQAMNLTNAGNKVTQIIEGARQRAMSANVQTAVILITNLPGSDVKNASGRAFAIAERAPGGTWKQFREWELLPDGVVVDLGAISEKTTFMSNSPASLPGGGEPPAYLGSTSYSYATRIFLPSGGLLNADQAARFQLVSGVVMGGGVNYTNRADNGSPANYYCISLLGTTGKTKVDRP